MIHARIETKTNNINAHEVIQTCITQLRKGDPMVKIIPVDSESYQPSEILEGHTPLSVEENLLSKWIINVRANRTKLHFTMKIKTIDMSNIRSVVFAWCKGKGTWVDFTSLTATTKFFGGWFHFLSPFYHNVDDFSTYIYDHAPTLKNKLDIYQKQIYNWTEDNKKVITVGIVVDGDFKVKDETFRFLFEHKWSGRYKNVTFIPYRTNEVLTKQDQIALMVSHNEFLKSLARIIIDANNPTQDHDVGTHNISFQSWLYQSTINQQHLIQGVEIVKDVVVRVFFNSGDTAAVKHAIHNLFKKVVHVFGSDIANSMLDENKLNRAKSSHDTELR